QARQHEREAGLLTPRPVLVGVDTGGTFTDLVAVVGGGLRVLKVRSTLHDPAAAVRAGLATLGGAARLHYGSTVATNALLERRGARVALLTTAGFEDLLEIGRQVRPELYALEPRRPPPLVPRARRIGVRERVLADGTVETPLARRRVAAAVAAVARSRATAVAVCLLHGYAAPAHERRLGRALAGRGLHVTLAHRLLREYREYERVATAALNAYVGPLMARHLRALAAVVPGRRLRIMQSGGGLIGAPVACAEPVRTILSGPAGGVVGAGERADRDRRESGPRSAGRERVPGRRDAPRPRARRAGDRAARAPPPTLRRGDRGRHRAGRERGHGARAARHHGRARARSAPFHA